jgi:hypothetical protein
MIDGGLLLDATQMKQDVLSAMCSTAEAWRLITPITIKDYSVKHGFLIYCVSSTDDSAVKMKRMNGIVYNLLECSLKTTQQVTLLLRFVESRVLHRFTRPKELAEYEVQHSSTH